MWTRTQRLMSARVRSYADSNEKSPNCISHQTEQLLSCFEDVLSNGQTPRPRRREEEELEEGSGVTQGNPKSKTAVFVAREGRGARGCSKLKVGNQGAGQTTHVVKSLA